MATATSRRASASNSRWDLARRARKHRTYAWFERAGRLGRRTTGAPGDSSSRGSLMHRPLGDQFDEELTPAPVSRILPNSDQVNHTAERYAVPRHPHREPMYT